MKIVITGDVHHSSMNTSDQKFCNIKEIECSYDYIKILKKYNFKTTLFYTGKSIKEIKKKHLKILNYKNLEIGGHNYFAFHPRLPWKISRILFNLKNGPCFVQNLDISKTIKIIKKKTGRNIVSWRSHGFRNDKNTTKLLIKNKIKFFSDKMDKNFRKPKFSNNKLIKIPVNVLVDHDNLIHGNRTPEIENFDYLKKISPFNIGLINKREWLKIVIKQIVKINREKGIPILLIHPICMKILDNFETFKKILNFIKKNKIETLSFNEIMKI